jgi:hypothetical protein
VSEQVEAEIEDLLLDHENPRLGSVGSQPEALRELVQLNPRNFIGMMESVKANGLDPGDLFYLVDETSETGIEGHTVLDGNRRLAALKVLREPALLAGADLPESLVRRLRAATEGFDPSLVGDRRLCVLFRDRGEANAWIERRHGRGQEGEGRISWGPLEIQRFQGDRSILDILDFIGRNGAYGPDEWATVRSRLERRSSVLRRFLESRAGRDALGLGETTEGDAVLPTSNRSPDYLLRLLRRLLDDIVSGALNTRTYNRAADIARYFTTLPPETNPDNAARNASATPFHDLNVVRPTIPTPPLPTPPPPPAPNPAPRLRDTLAPHHLPFNVPANAKGQQFIREATRVKLRSAPLSAAFLLRGFIQFVVDTYMRENDLPLRDGERPLDLSVRAERVIEHLIRSRRARRTDLNGIQRRLAEPARRHPASIQALNDYHHDEYQVPTADALRSGWDDATALFVAVLGRPNS